MRHKPLEPWAFLAPALLFLFIFIAVPVFFLLILSAGEWDVFAGKYSFTGLSNYLRILREPAFYRSFLNTAVFVFFTVAAGLAAALFLAVMLSEDMLGFSFYRTSIFIPVVVSLAAAGIIWSWMFDYQSGILNFLLNKIGRSSIDWLGDPDVALYSIIAVTLWKRIGYNMVIFLAGLKVIPEHLYDAAKIDGAGTIERFRYVTWPNLIPTTSFILVINLIFSFRDFAHIYVMTRGGPMGRTSTLVYYIYENAFTEYDIGYAAAVSIVLFIIVMGISALNIRYFGKYEKNVYG
jgi:ABC-type sugar transport system permease subunit